MLYIPLSGAALRLRASIKYFAQFSELRTAVAELVGENAKHIILSVARPPLLQLCVDWRHLDLLRVGDVVLAHQCDQQLEAVFVCNTAPASHASVWLWIPLAAIGNLSEDMNTRLGSESALEPIIDTSNFSVLSSNSIEQSNIVTPLLVRWPTDEPLRAWNASEIAHPSMQLAREAQSTTLE